MKTTEKKYTREEIKNFNEDDWNWRTSSGYGGYDHKDYPNDEQKWIYESDYRQRKHLKEQYEKDYKLIFAFMLDQTLFSFDVCSESQIHDFLNKKYFK